MLNKFLHWFCVRHLFAAADRSIGSVHNLRLRRDHHTPQRSERSAGGVGVLVGSAHHKVIYCGGVTYGSVFCVT
jgi:hypothetical protein